MNLDVYTTLRDETYRKSFGCVTDYRMDDAHVSFEIIFKNHYFNVVLSEKNSHQMNAYIEARFDVSGIKYFNNITLNTKGYINVAPFYAVFDWMIEHEPSVEKDNDVLRASKRFNDKYCKGVHRLNKLRYWYREMCPARSYLMTAIIDSILNKANELEYAQSKWEDETVCADRTKFSDALQAQYDYRCMCFRYSDIRNYMPNYDREKWDDITYSFECNANQIKDDLLKMVGKGKVTQSVLNTVIAFMNTDKFKELDYCA